MNKIEITVEDQFGKVSMAEARLRQALLSSPVSNPSQLNQQIEHIVIQGEIILPSTELLFESQVTQSIYRVVDVAENAVE